VGKGRKGEQPKLRTPFYPTKGERAYYKAESSDCKWVIDYTGCTYIEVMEMDVYTFWGLLHDAVVWALDKTAEGREYLENAWYYEQTEPDRDALREVFGGG
jgi:hypothetical protein